ncbi:hypothetical protein K0M31_017440 [Melipona bicolor]|uniref:Uncharacterized protein n=1 Tax=Melipona bicolor TaxID=60889 RepID=A0AA40G540_9HYME|nr:hypothetical protein K0M31_017440 [Melipona bicolor]
MDSRQSVCGDTPLHSNYRRCRSAPARLKFEFEEPTDYTCPDIEPRDPRHPSMPINLLNPRDRLAEEAG